MSLKQSYAGKRILITGTTGFLGKVLLEKFLYSLPEVDTIYILIRGKKGSTLLERFKKEILSSPCFDRLRNLYEHKFGLFIESKVRPIEGDLLKENVGLSENDLAQVRTQCHVIINCAASIDFNARLDDAINSNILGSLRMQKLAQSCQRLDIFTHVSTCYVNCNLRGLVREQIYDSNTNPEHDLQELLKLPLKQLIEQTPQIIKGFPNTYTFTKAMCERIMKRRKGEQTICIIRPAIINTSYSEPFPGWMDSVAAAAALFLFSGLGIIKQVYGYPWLIGDSVPVDIVVSNMIVATAYNMKKSNLSIYHVGSSDRNPITWRECAKITVDYWKHNLSQNRVAYPTAFMSSNKTKIQLHRLAQRVPVWMYAKAAPFLGKQHIKNVSKYQQAFQRADQIQKYFCFFMTNEWIYESRNVKDLINFLSPSERKEFLVDIAEIDMRYFIVLNSYGLQKYILKETIDLPTANSNILKREKSTYFSDIKWALNEGGAKIKEREGGQFKSKVLSSTRVLQAIEQETLKRLELKSGNIEAERKNVVKQANDIASEVIGEFKMPVVRFLAWTLHKVFKKIYEKVTLNTDVFEAFREIEDSMNIPIVLIPTHRSYIDFLIVSYIFFAYKLKLPYMVTDEALLSMRIIPFLIRSSGAFFYRKNQYRKSALYKVIFDEYIQRILMKGHNLQFFIEGRRSRTGKILAPQFQVLDIIMQAIFSEKVTDACLVPLTINYEKVLEADTFPEQLLGQEKVEESLLRVLKAIPLLKVNFGRVYVEFCTPIFVHEFINQQAKLNPRTQIVPLEQWKSQVVISLGEHIVQKMTQKLVIMSTGVVSAVLLMHRKGITEDLLLKTVNWLSKYIVKKGYKIGGINENSAALAVRNSMNYLSDITKKTKNSIFELQISAGDEFQKILMLSYYRNTIVHAFFPEAFVGCVLASFGKQLSYDEGVPLTRLHEETIFLTNVLRSQFSLPYNLEDPVKLKTIVEQMVRNGIVSYKMGPSEKIVIRPEQDQVIFFYISILRPLIECYWSVLIYLMTIAHSSEQKQEVSSMQKFYNYIQWYMESLFEEKVIENHEACSLEIIKNAFGTYEKMGLVKVTAVSRKEQRIETIGSIEKLRQLSNNLKNFAKNMVNNSLTSPMEIAKSSVMGGEQSKL